MQIILLSGGSGKRLWPLSNDTHSKQFLKLLTAPDGSMESMLQRTARQIHSSELEASLTVATSVSQLDSVRNQLGSKVDVVTEPMRSGTFPSIALSCAHLFTEKNCTEDEVVVVIPSDAYVDTSYFSTINQMAQGVKDNIADVILMGIPAREASSKFGYILPQNTPTEQITKVRCFKEKPDTSTAEKLIKQGAVWNGGVFAFKLGYMIDIIKEFNPVKSFKDVHDNYQSLPKISFDYQVLEKASSMALVSYNGCWSDLGTWDTLTDKINNTVIGDAVVDSSTNTHVINELSTPVVCLGADNLIVAASPDGILVSHKQASRNLKNYADSFTTRPMYEERRWGKYRVMGHEHFGDGHHALTKLLYLNAGCNISYQYHNHREEIWTFVDGQGILILDGETIPVSRGYVAHIKAGQKHAVRAITELQIIEVQSGTDLIEEDIIRLDWQW